MRRMVLDTCHARARPRGGAPRRIQAKARLAETACCGWKCGCRSDLVAILLPFRVDA
jgi:hypothetical protein